LPLPSSPHWVPTTTTFGKSMPSFSQAGYYLNTGAGKIKKKKSP
jgi:hypothetical protein